MKKTLWFTLPILIIFWFLVFKYLNGTETSDFKFSKRDQETVFPTPRETILDISPTQKITLEVTPVASSASDSNLPRF